MRILSTEGRDVWAHPNPKGSKGLDTKFVRLLSNLEFAPLGVKRSCLSTYKPRFHPKPLIKGWFCHERGFPRKGQESGYGGLGSMLQETAKPPPTLMVRPNRRILFSGFSANRVVIQRAVTLVCQTNSIVPTAEKDGLVNSWFHHISHDVTARLP